MFRMKSGSSVCCLNLRTIAFEICLRTFRVLTKSEATKADYTVASA
jgi:hypothetical protein